MTRRFQPPSECPVCGAAVPPGARACPECGADERAGWDEEASLYDDLDLPEVPRDEGEQEMAREGRRKARANGVAVFWWIVGVLVLASFVCLMLKSAF